MANPSESRQPDLFDYMARQQAINDYHDRRRQRLQARGYKPPVRKFPAALLKQYNIRPGENWTRQQAWAALTAAGCDIGQVYHDLRDKKREDDKNVNA